jgi:hydroxymethylpyrimidine pyrophosphatase-like HAD family hydrolase
MRLQKPTSGRHSRRAEAAGGLRRGCRASSRHIRHRRPLPEYLLQTWPDLRFQWLGPLAGSFDMLDLLLDLDGISALLLEELAGGDCTRSSGKEHVLDAFLLAAGMNQIVEDYLHRDVYSLGRVAARIGELVHPPAGSLASASTRLARSAGLGLRARTARHRSLVHWQGELAALVGRLAEKVAAGVERAGAETRGDPTAEVEPDLLLAARDVIEPVARCPESLRTSVVRLAQCFRSFDQRPEDCRRLARLLSTRFPDRARPILVVGLRTSGGYLAPLHRAFLKMDGYADVAFLTLRPGHDLLSHELERIAESVLADGLVCVVDDPPRTGGQLAHAAERLRRLGVRPQSLVLLVQLFGTSASLPSRLMEYESIVLPRQRSSIRDKLSERAVRQTLVRLVRGQTIAISTGAGSREVVVGEIEDVKRLNTWATRVPPGHRGHASAVFRARIVEEGSGEQVEQDIYVRGVGLGYLGRHAVTVASRLAPFLPEVYGFDDGLLYRTWLPEDWRLSPPSPPEDETVAARVASYVVARRDALAVAEDVSRRLVHREPVWEIVASMLGDAFGKAKYVVHPLTTRIAIRLVKTTRPSVVDGSMALSRWFRPSTEPIVEGTIRKVDFAARAFSNEDTYCYDAVFDLACAAADYAALSPAHPAALEFGDRLRTQYERAAGETITGERWLLYQLLYHHRIARRDYDAAVRGTAEEREHSPTALARFLAAQNAMALAHQRYFGDLFFADRATPDSGPLCAIDVDGVLETRWLSFPAISSAGAMALRALACHGYRPVLATGRSLAEVRARCIAFRLPGGVAEYGAVVYDHISGRVRSLLTSADQDELAALRAILLGTPGVQLDPLYEHGIRAYRVDSHGRPSGLDAATIQDVLTRTGDPKRIRPIPAHSQTDFTVAHVDKGAGLRILADELDGTSSKRSESQFAFAIGDTVSDLSMCVLASRAFAPSNADPELRTLSALGSHDIDFVARPYQAGLLLAVSTFLGHRPTKCDVCSQPRPRSKDTRILLAALGALDGGRREKAKQALLLAGLLHDRDSARRGPVV